MKIKRKISLLIPVYNEELVLQLLFDRITAFITHQTNYTWEILFVNDGSRDSSLQLMKELRKVDKRVHYLDLSRNFGKESAMMAGLDFVTGDGVVLLDADLQHPPEIISEMIENWELGYDDIAAKRNSLKGESFLKRISSKLFYALLSRTTHIPIQRNTGDFRFLDRKCIEAIRQFTEKQRYTKGIYDWIGFNKKTILFTQGKRAAGHTKWNYFQLFNLAIVGITSFTITPLRFSTILGSIVSTFSIVYGIIIMVKSIFYNQDIQDYTILLFIILFFGGVQLLSIGILGEYLGLIFKETKNRPSYLVKSSSLENNGLTRSDEIS